MKRFSDANGWQRGRLDVPASCFPPAPFFFYCHSFWSFIFNFAKGWRGKWDSNRSEQEVLFRAQEEAVRDKYKPDRRSLVVPSSLRSLSTPTMTPLSHTAHSECVCVLQRHCQYAHHFQTCIVCVFPQKDQSTPVLCLDKNPKAHTHLLFVECVFACECKTQQIVLISCS